MWKKGYEKIILEDIKFLKYKLKIVVGSDQIIIDEVEMGVHLMRNKIGEIFQDVFVRDVNRLIYAAVFQFWHTITKAFSPFHPEETTIYWSLSAWWAYGLVNSRAVSQLIMRVHAPKLEYKLVHLYS